MSYQLNQSLSLYIPFVRDDVSLETFRETFHQDNIGKVSVVDFIFKTDTPLREAFVHFELFYNTKQAYDFQLILESEQRIRIFYNEKTFWSISKNFSKKASVATLGGRKICLNLTDDTATPVGEDEDHYLSDIDLAEEWKEEFNSVYEDDEQSSDLSEEEFVQVHATAEEMALVSSDYPAALEKHIDMLQGQLEFIAYDYAVQNDQIQRQQNEIEHLYLLLAEKDALLEKKEQEKMEIVKYWQQTGRQIQEKVEEKKDCLLEAITRNGYNEFKKINEFAQEREEKLVEILEEMRQEWSAKIGTYAEEFEKQMEHMKMMMTRSRHMEDTRFIQEKDEEQRLSTQQGWAIQAQRQVAAPESELTYLRQLDTFEGMATQYTYQYMIPTPQTYHEFVKDEDHTIMGIIKSHVLLQSRSDILSIMENGKAPVDFPVNSFRV